MPVVSPEPPESVRLDKWLWAARFFKTRQLSIEAISAGHIELNGDRAKPAKSVKLGDEIQVRKPPYRIYRHRESRFGKARLRHHRA